MKIPAFFQLRIPTLPIDTNFLVSDTLSYVEKMKEAIFVASASFFQHGTDFTNISNDNTGYKYLSRICTRSTPYGLFAGVLTGNIERETKVIVKGITSSVDLDISCCQELSTYLEDKIFVKENILHYANNSIYEVGDYYRYLEYEVDVKKQRKYGISSVEKNDILTEIINLSKKGCLLKEGCKSLIGPKIT